jgi:23S rRNA pseudouridine2605 synthase
LAKKLAHPKYNKKKIYHVYLDKKIIKEDMYKLTEGIELEDGLMTFDKINFVSLDTKTEVGVEIHSGKNRIVRRMFESLDYKVIKLDRVYFAGLTKKGLGRGFWRYLTEKEIQTLKSGSYE